MSAIICRAASPAAKQKRGSFRPRALDWFELVGGSGFDDEGDRGLLGSLFLFVAFVFFVATTAATAAGEGGHGGDGDECYCNEDCFHNAATFRHSCNESN